MLDLLLKIAIVNRKSSVRKTLKHKHVWERIELYQNKKQLVIKMKLITFKAFAITNEIDLNKIAIRCGIPKKFTWEEPLILQGDILNFILQKNVDESQKVLVFSFGS